MTVPNFFYNPLKKTVYQLNPILSNIHYPSHQSVKFIQGRENMR